MLHWEGETEMLKLPGIVLGGIPRLGQEAAGLWMASDLRPRISPSPVCFFFFNQCDFSAVRLLLIIRNILSQESAFSLQPSLLWWFRGSFSKTGGRPWLSHTEGERPRCPRAPHSRPSLPSRVCTAFIKRESALQSNNILGVVTEGPPQ